MKKILKNYQYIILFSGIGVVYFFNLFVDIMEVDAAQYAMMSMEMSFSKSFLHVYENGKDYLDKPPFLFWTSALSYLVFGISNFSYKLPSVLFAILGLYSTYRFSKLYYNKQTALLASLILGTTQALFLITNDIRTDTILMGATIFSIWQMAEYLRSGRFKYLIFLSIGIAVGMMTKGPLILIIIAAAFGSEFLIKRQWNNIFKAEWLLMFLFVAILLFPMCWGLYTQFDLHPEKSAYGIDSPSGIKFFFWTQSFGRITGESALKNDSGFFYFFHTILWDFQPWILFFIPALYQRIKNLIIGFLSKINFKNEYISLCGFILVFLALSLSKYKLPHYIFSIFPFAAIITAQFIMGFNSKITAKVSIFQFGILHVFWVAIGCLFTLFFPIKTIYFVLIFVLGYGLYAILFAKLKGLKERLIIPTLFTALFFNLMLALHFYPNLLLYQSSTLAGRHIKKNNLSIHSYNIDHNALHFYAKKLIQPFSLKDIENASPGEYVYTDEDGYNLIKDQRAIKEIKKFPYFKATQLTLPFLIAQTRQKTLKKMYIIELD